MNTLNFDREWDFVIAETHGREATKEKLLKREILLTLQILLGQVGRAIEKNKRYFLQQNYFALKEMYRKEK